jgi:hypothetical protein
MMKRFLMQSLFMGASGIGRQVHRQALQHGREVTVPP